MGTPRPGRMNAPGKTEPTEAIARARAGDAEAWGELYREYAPAMFRFCRRALPTREDAEDATMEIFMKLKVKLVQYDATRSFSAWLYKVAANHYWDMSYDEIADELGVRRAFVGVVLLRARHYFFQ